MKTHRVRQSNTIAIDIKEVTFIGTVKGGVKYICLSQDDQLIKVERKSILQLVDALKSFQENEEEAI